MAFRWSRFGAAVLFIAAVSVSGCDDGQPQQEQSLELPRGENPLDGLLNASQPRRTIRPAHIEAAPGGVDFSEVTVGRTVDHDVALVNGGDGAALVKAVRLSGDTTAFRLAGSCGSDHRLEGGDSCSVTISFAPDGPGVRRGDIVVTVEGTGQEPLFISLTGIGVAPAPAALPPPAPAAFAAPRAEAALIYASARQGAGFAIDRLEPAVAPTAGPAHEEDYRVAGLPGIVSTFPVDRSRVITADRYIPAVLENTLNSQLGGRAIAVVERHVYGADGRTVLLPAGSRVIGRFGSLGRAGTSRLGVVWSRILRPDGVSINIEDEGADIMGRSGLPGDLDSRFFEKYGSSLLVSAISAATTGVLGDDTTTVVTNQAVATSSSARAKAVDQLAEDVSAIGQRMISDNVDLTPVLTVAQGTRLVIVPTEDIWLRDPNRIVAVTPPKAGKPLDVSGEKVAALAERVPETLTLLLKNPTAMRALSPQALQQILQSMALQGLSGRGSAGDGGSEAAMVEGQTP
jgi:type IV secretion system protein VirB10